MDEEEDYYISHGTPLPEIEEESVLRKKAARELEVRDDKGRQRFHGAFTGGFSAGYFNTVGTKEGWAPSTFVSSRDKKYKDNVLQNPEDFMDEEDLGEFGIATRKIHTTSKFQDSFDSRPRKRIFAEVDSAIPGEAPLKDIVKPIQDSIGIEILKKLGWKLGQGIGPRIKKPHSSIKVYGCSPFPKAVEAEEDDPFSQSYTFAPEDTEVEIYKPKDDVFGLGYSGLSKESVLSVHIDTFNPTTTKSFLKKDKKKLTISGQAFGVGAFEDDDDDIYSKDDMSQYDFSDLDRKELTQASKDNRTGQLLDSSSAVIEGFRVASEPPAIKKYYPPPDLPPNYRPLRSSVPKVIDHSEPQFKSRHGMSSEDRSLLLGERKFKPFQLTSEKKTVDVKPDLENVNNSFLNSKHSFRPFPNDDIKQKRYEEYVKLLNLGETEKLVQPPSMTEWEKQQELEEFARAAVLFKPLSAALSSKFESRSHLSVEHEVMEELAKARKESKQKVVEKRKLVGLSNRKTSEWHPASLLCKRFNVPNPYPNSSEVSGAPKSKSLFDHISFNSRQEDKNYPSSSSFPQAEAVNENVPIPIKSPMEITPKSIDAASDKTTSSQDQLPESGRPPIDFFKDIFENSSDDEDSSQSELIQASTKTESSQNPVEHPATSSEADEPNKTLVIENKKAGFGVFANIDLDALNQRIPKVKSSSQDFEIKCDIIDISGSPVSDSKTLNDAPQLCGQNSSLSSDLYGPDLPPNYSELSTRSPPKFEHKKHSKHKIKHKHKHHKHKGKKKKKKHSSHKSSEDSSFDSDEDIPPTVILEKLKKLQSFMK